MDQFVDEVYENMDDISKLIEPYEYKVNEELSRFPEEIELDHSVFLKIVSNNWNESTSASLSSISYDKATALNLDALAKEIKENFQFVNKTFEFALVPDEGELSNIFYDAESGLMMGKVFLRKKDVIVEDADIEMKMKVSIAKIYHSFNSASEINTKRVNEIADLFGADKVRKERRHRHKVTLLTEFYQKMLTDKRLPIKDVNLFNRFLDWNVKYIKDGNLPAMANLSKLKIMLRNGLPIYSIKDEQ